MNNSLSIVQSSLISFDKDYSWNIVDLDVNSLKNDCVLVMDSFKEIVVWKGESVYKLEVNNEMTDNVEWMIVESIKYAKDQASARNPYPRVIPDRYGTQQERAPPPIKVARTGAHWIPDWGKTPRMQALAMTNSRTGNDNV